MVAVSRKSASKLPVAGARFNGLMTQEDEETIDAVRGGARVGYTGVSTVAQTLEQQNAAL